MKYGSKAIIFFVYHIMDHGQVDSHMWLSLVGRMCPWICQLYTVRWIYVPILDVSYVPIGNKRYNKFSYSFISYIRVSSSIVRFFLIVVITLAYKSQN